MLKFGLAVTTSANPEETALGQAEYAAQVAALAEALGFDSVWVSDRTIVPADLAARYPEQFGPGLSNPAAQNLLEALTVLGYLAGRFPRLRLGASVLVLPFRQPVLCAKMVNSLDVLSGGRVILGVGTGWMPEEFEGLAASFAERGPLTDEYIALYQTLCAQDVVEFHGRFYHMSGMLCFPKPVQQPHPPIWIGGNSAAALRRAARLGDGWHGIQLAPAEVARKAAELRAWCARLGRPPEAVSLSLRATLALGQDRRAPGGQRAPLSGPPAQVLDDLRRYRDLGLDTLALSVRAPDTPATLAAIQQLADLIVRL